MLNNVNNEKHIGVDIDHKLSWTNQYEMAIHKSRINLIYSEEHVI